MSSKFRKKPFNRDDLRFRVEAARIKRGQHMAFVLVVLGFALIAFAVQKGNTAVGVSVSTTLLVAVIGGFLRQHKRCKNCPEDGSHNPGEEAGQEGEADESAQVNEPSV